MDPRILNVGCSRCPGWNLGNITVRVDVDHLGLPVRSYTRRAHAHIVPPTCSCALIG